MKLRLEDQGDGWFWSRPAIEAEVVEQVWYHSRRYYKVRLHPPLEQQESGAPSPSGSRLVVYHVAWLSPRWVGHEIGPESGTSAFLWLARGEGESAPPPADTSPSARVSVRMCSGSSDG